MDVDDNALAFDYKTYYYAREGKVGLKEEVE